jgi:uncharacterized protein (DUF1778 family)
MDETAERKRSAHTAAQNRYILKAYDRINFAVPKGVKDEIKAAADAAGQSVNAYILDAVRERMQR